MSVSDRILGALLGLAAGDAIGAGTPGRVTAITQQALFTVEGMLRAEVRYAHRGLSSPAGVVGNAWLRWLYVQDLPVPGDRVREGWPDGWLAADERIRWRRGESAAVTAAAPVGLRMPARGGDATPAYTTAEECASRLWDQPSAATAGAFAMVLALLVDGASYPDAVAEVSAFAKDLPGPVGAAFGDDPPNDGAGAPVGFAVRAASAGDFGRAIRVAQLSPSPAATAAMIGLLLGASQGTAAVARYADGLEARDVVERLARDLAAFREGTADLRADATWAAYPGW